MKISLAVTLLLSMAFGNGWAQGIILTYPGEFSGPTTLIDFEEYPDGTEVPYFPPSVSTQWVELGIWITDSSPETPARAGAGTRGVDPHSGAHAVADSEAATEGGFVLVSFVQYDMRVPALVSEAGVWVQNGDLPSTVSFYDRNNSLIRSLTTSGNDAFVGLIYDDGISAIRVEDPDFNMVDDLQFGPVTPIPEPSTCALMLFGAISWFILRRQYSPR